VLLVEGKLGLLNLTCRGILNVSTSWRDVRLVEGKLDVLYLVLQGVL